MKWKAMAVCLAACSLWAGSAQAVVLDFDDLVGDSIVTTQFTEAAFSTEAGYQITVYSRNLGASPPNFICTDPAGQPGDTLGCTNDIYIDFTSPVTALTFLALGDDLPGTTALVNVYHHNGNAMTTVDIVTDGDPFAPDTVDLRSFNDVTRIEIHSVTDAYGLGFDDFSFVPQSVAPEPLTAIPLGMGLVVTTMRRGTRQNTSHI